MKIVFLILLACILFQPMFSQYNFACNSDIIDSNEEAFFYVSTTAINSDSAWVLKCSLDDFGTHILDTVFASDLLFQSIGIGIGENDTTTFFGELNNASCTYDAETGTFGPFVNIGRNYAGHRHHIWASDTFEVYYYNTASGATLTVDIYEAIDDETRVKTADCAVDQHGNVWFVTGIDIALDWATESIVCMDTTGAILNTYNFEINSRNAYGMMFLGTDLYIGFGGFNNTYPHQLCKIDFNGNNAEIGETYEFEDTNTYYNDLASCNEFETSALPENQGTNLLIYPNPVLDELHLENFAQNSDIEILSLTGEICYYRKNVSPQTTIDMTDFAHGMYVVRIYNEYGNPIRTFRVVRT